jgi:mRNA-degrading endonuclease RelE of RelBE toxin-antitoxin system
MTNFDTNVWDAVATAAPKMPKKLLSPGSTNAKTAKNEIKTFILYLMPYNQNSEGRNLCPHASKGCAAACLVSAGRGAFSNVIKARVNKTELFIKNKLTFLNKLATEIMQETAKAKRGGYRVAFRLNGTSDVDFIYMLKKYGFLDIETLQPHAVFYDYTKNIQKAIRYKGHPNYTVTFSRSESNTLNCETAIRHGVNVAAVFNELPDTWRGVEVIDGDKSDLQMLKYNGVILGLKAKGAARKDTTGFTILNK